MSATRGTGYSTSEKIQGQIMRKVCRGARARITIDRVRRVSRGTWSIGHPLMSSRQVDKMDKKALALQKQEMYQDFLNNTNTKPLFRDIIIESDYDPLAWRRDAVCRFVGEYIRGCPMRLTCLECQVAKLANSDACPRPTTGLLQQQQDRGPREG